MVIKAISKQSKVDRTSDKIENAISVPDFLSKEADQIQKINKETSRFDERDNSFEMVEDLEAKDFIKQASPVLDYPISKRDNNKQIDPCKEGKSETISKYNSKSISNDIGSPHFSNKECRSTIKLDEFDPCKKSNEGSVEEPSSIHASPQCLPQPSLKLKVRRVNLIEEARRHSLESQKHSFTESISSFTRRFTDHSPENL